MDTYQPPLQETALGVIYGIYDTREPDRIRYVGQSTRVARRWVEHRTSAQKTGKGRLYCWMRSSKHPPEFVDYRILETGLTPGVELDEAEMRHIRELRKGGNADLNMTDGGFGCRGYKQSDEQRKATSERFKGRYRGDKGPNNVLNWEQVREIRALRKKKWVSEAVLGPRYNTTQSTINGVLRNLSWHDPEFDPKSLVKRPPSTHRNHVKSDWETINAIRDHRKREWISEEKLSDIYGVSRGVIWMVLKNTKWYDPNFDPNDLIPPGVDGRPTAKITASDVVEIRRRCNEGEFQRVVGEDFGLSQTQVGRIVRGDRWAHIPDYLEPKDTK